VETIGENATSTLEQAIEPLRETDRERLHPLSEARGVPSLHDEMKVIRLHRVVNDACIARSRQAQGLTHDTKGPPFAQIRQAGNQPQRDVHGKVLRHARARDVRDAS
jgi:hypothetical protein